MLASSRCHDSTAYPNHHSSMAAQDDATSSAVVLIPRSRESPDRGGDSAPSSPAEASPLPRRQDAWQEDEALDLSPCSVKDNDSQKNIDELQQGDDDDVRIMDDMDSESLDDSDASGDGSSHCDTTMVEAKRARVENIVTNIRDRPAKCKSTNSCDDLMDGAIIDEEIAKSHQADEDIRKRSIEEKLRKMQDKLLQQGGISSPSEFIQQALSLIASGEAQHNQPLLDNNAAAISSSSPPADPSSWTPSSKRPRLDEPVDYRGAIKVAIPPAPSNLLPTPDNAVYGVILDTLKRELSFVFDKVTERLARRVLEELEIQSSSSPKAQTPSSVSDEVFVSEKADGKRVTADQHIGGEAAKHHSPATGTNRGSSFVVDANRVDHLRTSSQSQLCFGDVEVRRYGSADRDAHAVGQRAHMIVDPSRRSTEQMQNTAETLVKTEKSKEQQSNARVQALIRNAEEDEQTHPLSLVTRKNLPAENGRKEIQTQLSSMKAFVHLDARKRSKIEEDARSRMRNASSGSSRGEKRDQSSFHRDESRCNTDLRASNHTLEKSSYSPGPRKNSVFSSFFPGRTPSLLPMHDSPFKNPSGWSFPSANGAFRHPARQQNGGSPGHQYSSMHLDAQHKLISNLSSASESNHLKNPTLSSPYFPNKSHLPSPLYSPLQSSPLSSYPFPTSQIPFPLIPAFNHGALASALASRDYGRLREGLDPTGMRQLSTRTSTRENSKSRVSAMGNHHMDVKCDSSEYGSNSTDVSPYSAASIQEGLTPQHLKKAKLMFFYTRYPSANTLKTYFSDVKFTRATTSQLIKWFSNFREFYYIQVEKFARQALTDGVTDANQLQVARDSEVFRVLNLHYNKSNDFRVPDRFIDVTHTSLQEFFVAIQSTKDHDPAWKKVIYKVICKLDQDIPEIFKSPNVLEHLNEV